MRVAIPFRPFTRVILSLMPPRMQHQPPVRSPHSRPGTLYVRSRQALGFAFAGNCNRSRREISQKKAPPGEGLLRILSRLTGQPSRTVNQPLHEPGRYLIGTVVAGVSVDEPHLQPQSGSVVPILPELARVAESINGNKVTTLLSRLVLLNPVVVIDTLPSASVAILLTYLVAVVVSQPQPLAPGGLLVFPV